MPASYSHDILHNVVESLNEMLVSLIICTIFISLWLIIATSTVVFFVFSFTPYVMFAAFLLGFIYSAWFSMVIPICMLTTHYPNLDKKELWQMTIERIRRFNDEVERKEKEACEQYLRQEQDFLNTRVMSPDAKECLIEMLLNDDYELESQRKI